MKSNISSHKISLIHNRKLKIFLFCLVLTTVLWLLVELSKTYNSQASFNVVYTNIPENLLFQNKPVDKLSLELRAPGFSLLKYKIRNKKGSLNLQNIYKNNRGFYILPNNQKVRLTSQLSGEVEVIRVSTDTIFIDLGVNVSKKVPVNLQADLKFKLGYNLIEKVQLVPDSIVILGPEKHIDSIQEISTLPLSLKDVYEDFNVEIELHQPKEQLNVNLSIKKIQLIGKVDKFTEGHFKIPVTVINEPEGIKINPFPKEIEVVYKAGLSNFSKINENSLLIVYDYKQYEKDSLITFLTPVIKQQSEYITSFKIIPSQIEFLIQK